MSSVILIRMYPDIRSKLDRGKNGTASMQRSAIHATRFGVEYRRPDHRTTLGGLDLCHLNKLKLWF